ncbi:TonB-dependent receptor plug domain-containing protein, partial [bacterium]|nr:TonB-dependent receptor plug domain-containing protein [bacterium]
LLFLISTNIQLHASLELSLGNIFDLSVETGSLTNSSIQEHPASITIITNQQIQDSGARRLDELLEIYVPNLQRMRHFFGMDHIGVRGILPDRDNKILFMVNHKIMNDRSLVGAYTERDLPMLSDIRQIEVIRGSGGAMYGPGALSMVINVLTYDSSNFSGEELTLKAGFSEEFQSLEYKVSHHLSKGDLYAYFGISNYIGASITQAPYHLGLPVAAESYLTGDVPNYQYSKDRSAFRNHPKQKYHLSYSQANFKTWLRYTSGGEQHLLPRFQSITESQDFHDPTHFDYGYKQFTIQTEWSAITDNRSNIQINLAYDTFNYLRVRNNQLGLNNGQVVSYNTFAYREDEVSLSLTVKRPAFGKIKTSFGLNYSYEIFAKNSEGFPNTEASRAFFGPSWNTSVFSPFYELKYKHDSFYTSYLAFRADKHSYTPWLVSPSFVLIHKLNDRQNLRFAINRSYRRNNDEVLRKAFVAGTISNNEAFLHKELAFTHNNGRGFQSTWTLFEQ